jgi:hypothetical protein
MRITGVNPGIKKGIILGLIAAAMLGSAVYAAEDPAELATTYEKQAADLRASADKHDSMAKMHRSGSAGSSKMNHENIVRHCEKIAEDLRAAAQESDALAAELRSSAKK